MARRKNKQTRKYKPRNEFRYNNSYVGRGHPNYVFGETEKNYKSLSITHSPNKKYKNVKLQKNPNPNDNSVAYLEVKPKTGKKEYFSKPIEGWKFSSIDMSAIRNITKKYKKSYNRNKKRK